MQDELRFVLITSDAKVVALDEGLTKNEGILVEPVKSPYEKCERCWQRRADVNSDENYPGICGRCIDNIAGAGEVRHFA